MSDAAFLADLAAILEVPAASVGDDFELTADNWDSLAVLSTIALIDSTYEIIVPADDLMAARSIGELRRFIDAARSAG